MIAAERVEDIPADPRPAFVALGVFDGVHLGHQRLLRELAERSRSAGARSLAITFHPHPQAVLAPEKAPPLLSTLEERRRLIAGLGVEVLLVLRFTRQTAAIEAEEFAAEWLVRRLRAAAVFVGYNFTFGRGGRGDAKLLARLGAELGFATEIMPPVRTGGRVVSSTNIRRDVQAGRVEAAAEALGRPYSLAGTVVPGEGRGRTLGFPTANLELPPGLCRPAAGVYAVCAETGAGALYAGVANIGWRPTFGGQPGGGREVLEVHLFDFAEEVYGRELRVNFLARLRDERRFPSPEALREQIARDMASARLLVAECFTSPNRCAKMGATLRSDRR